MTEYVKSTNFTSKDSLASGNPLKIIKGAEFDTEFNNIATAVSTKADLADPTFTGVPAAPTAATGTNTTQVATTAFVANAVAEGKINTALTGVPTAPTATVNTSTTQVATTAFVTAQIADDAPSKIGGGASGTWGIEAATATTDNQHIGISQTWQNVTGSRSSGTTYTNSSARPISVHISGATNTSGLGLYSFVVSGVTIAAGHTSSQGVASTFYIGAGPFIVPPGATYSATFSFSSGTNWSELR